MDGRSWVIPLKMPDSQPNGNRPNAVLRIIAISSRPATRAGGLKTAPESNFPPIAAHGTSSATPLQRQEFFPRAAAVAPSVGLRPHSGATAAAHSHPGCRIALPQEDSIPRKGGQYWTRKGVAIGRDLTVGGYSAARGVGAGGDSGST